MPITKALHDLVGFATEQIYLRSQNRHTMYIRVKQHWPAEAEPNPLRCVAGHSPFANRQPRNAASLAASHPPLGSARNGLLTIRQPAF